VEYNCTLYVVHGYKTCFVLHLHSVSIIMTRTCLFVSLTDFTSAEIYKNGSCILKNFHRSQRYLLDVSKWPILC